MPYTKPMVTIDLDEYNALKAFNSSQDIVFLENTIKNMLKSLITGNSHTGVRYDASVAPLFEVLKKAGISFSMQDGTNLEMIRTKP